MKSNLSEEEFVELCQSEATVITVKVAVNDTVDDIQDKVLDRIRLHLNGVFKRAAGSIQQRIMGVCESLIKDTDEYKSLLNDELLGELGVPNIKPRLDNILNTIKNGIEVQAIPMTRRGSVFSGGLVYKMIRSDFLDILGLPDAAYQTEKGTTIPWLEWLLLQGDTIIVIGYDVRFGLSPKEKYRSRTGLALMTKGKGWRVDPRFSGTLEDNFITRAFIPSKVESLLLRITDDEISSRV